jgi:hypothetical protein
MNRGIKPMTEATAALIGALIGPMGGVAGGFLALSLRYEQAKLQHEPLLLKPSTNLEVH